MVGRKEGRVMVRERERKERSVRSYEIFLVTERGRREREREMDE
jgi:hypothetical protein